MVKTLLKVGRTSLLAVTLLMSTMTGAFATGSEVNPGVIELNNPNVNQPDPNQPGPNQPDPNQPGPNQPGPNQPGPNQPGPNQPGPNQPGPNQPGPNQPGPNQPDPNQPEPNNPDENTGTDEKSAVTFLVNGLPMNLGTVTDTIVDGQAVTTISLDDQALENVIASGVDNEIISIPVNTDSDQVVSQLSGAAATSLGEQQMTLQVMTSFGSYNLPMDQVGAEEIIGQFGADMKPEDVTVEIKITQSSDEEVEEITDIVENLGGELLGTPVSFDVAMFSSLSTGASVSALVNSFDTFVTRTIPIPLTKAGTGSVTGGVMEADGTFRPVPISTEVFLEDGGTLRPDGSIIYPPLKSDGRNKAEAEERRMREEEARLAGGTVRSDGSVIFPILKGRPDKTGKGYAKLSSKTNSTYVVFSNSVTFDDVNNHWAKDTINEMGSRMIASGTDDGKFNPDQHATRAEFAEIMVRGLGLKLEKGKTKFSDIKATDKYNDVIKTANAHGLINGFTDGTFRPNEKITREQAMTIMSVAMKMTGLKDTLSAQAPIGALSAFSDASKVSNWAKAGVNDSLQAKIFSGKTSTQLAPKAFITRAEVTVIVKRLLENSNLI